MSDPAQKRPVGRPSKFTPELGALICKRMSKGRSLRTVCKAEGMPDIGTVLRWLAKEGPEWDEFRRQYARAREAMADAMSEEILDIADDGSNDTYVDDEGKTKTDWDVVARSKLRIDARKWLLSKVAPRKYGERITQEHTGDGLTALADALDSGRKRTAAGGSQS